MHEIIFKWRLLLFWGLIYHAPIPFSLKCTNNFIAIGGPLSNLFNLVGNIILANQWNNIFIPCTLLPHQSEVLKDKADETKTRARRYKHIARYQRDAQKMWALQTFDMFMMRRGRSLMCKGQCACLPLCGCVIGMDVMCL